MGQLQDKYKSYREPQKFMDAGVYPYFREITSKQGTEVTDIDGNEILMFGSNAYTGLPNDPRVINAAQRALEKYGSGCAGSRFLMVHSIFMFSWRKSLLLLKARMRRLFFNRFFCKCWCPLCCSRTW